MEQKHRQTIRTNLRMKVWPALYDLHLRENRNLMLRSISSLARLDELDPTIFAFPLQFHVNLMLRSKILTCVTT